MKRNMLKGNIMEFIVDANIPTELTDLCRILKKLGKAKSHKFMITTDLTLAQFHTNLGHAVADSTYFRLDLPEAMKSDSDEVMYELMGRMILDTYLEDTYYIKSKGDMKLYEIRGVVKDGN